LAQAVLLIRIQPTMLAHMLVKMAPILYSGLSPQQEVVVAATAIMVALTKTLNLAVQVVAVGMVRNSGCQAHLGKATLVVPVVPRLRMAVAVAAQVKLVKPSMMALDRLRAVTALLRQLLAHLFIEQVVAALEHIPDKQDQFLLLAVWVAAAPAVTLLERTTLLHITELQIQAVAVVPQDTAAPAS